MAKKAPSRKPVKKAAKKSPAKSAKKSAKPAKKAAKKSAPKKAVKTAAKKSSPKKAAKKASPKKAVKKAIKAAIKKASPKKAAVKKAVKKVVKKVAKKAAAPAKKLVSKAKAVAKKVTAPVKKAVKRAPQKTFVAKAKTAISNMTHTVSDFMKDAATTVIDKITPEKTSEDSGSHESSSNASSEHSDHSDSSEKESGAGDDEEERPSFVKHKTHLKAGDKAPYFEGKDQHGNAVNLHSFPGKSIILYFYPKDDTPGCTATACSLRDEHQFLSNKNYAVLGVSADDEKSHMKFANKYELPFPLLADTDRKVIKAYDVFGKKQFMGRISDGIIRTTFVIGVDGVIKEVITDVDTENHAQQILEMEHSD